MVSRPHTRQQIEQETEDPERVDEGNDPFEDARDVRVGCVGAGREDDGQDKLDDDEGEFDPEASCEDPVVPVVDAEALVFGAQEDRADDVPADEE